MNLVNTKIRVNGPEQSKQYQEAVFAAGGSWHSGDRYIKHEYLPYLYVNEFNSMFTTSQPDQFEQNPSPDITDEFFGITQKPLKIENPKIGNKIYHEKDPQQNLHTILYIGDQLALIQKNYDGLETAVDSSFTEWVRFEPFSLLNVDDPVWVRDKPHEEWTPRHYAGNKHVFAFGRTFHSQTESGPRYTYRYWKHKTLGEWEDNQE